VTGSAERVEVPVAQEIWRAGDTVVDVRTPGEYATGHLPGAINVPIDRLAFEVRNLPAGQLLTVCSMGNRSWRAAQLLAAAGREALSLTGGTKAWAAAGLPLHRGAEPTDQNKRRFGRRR
jgi:rhodanese-related sulfurtransferase